MGRASQAIRYKLSTHRMPTNIGRSMAQTIDDGRDGKPIIYFPPYHGAGVFRSIDLEKEFRKRRIPYMSLPFLVEKTRNSFPCPAQVYSPSPEELRKAEQIFVERKYVIVDDVCGEGITVSALYDCLLFHGIDDQDILMGAVIDGSGALDFSYHSLCKYRDRRKILEELKKSRKIRPASEYFSEESLDLGYRDGTGARFSRMLNLLSWSKEMKPGDAFVELMSGLYEK